MRLTLRVLGILSAVVTVVLSLSLLMNEYNVGNQEKQSWSMIAVCGILIFNGGYYYLKNKNKQGLMMAIIGIVILIVVLFTLPF